MSGQLFAAGLMSAIIVAIAALMHFVPLWTRPDLYFAVTVDPAFRATPDGVRILRRYRTEVWLHAIVAALLVAIATVGEFPAMIPLGPLYQAAAIVVTLVRARALVRPFALQPTPVREAPLAPRDARVPGGALALIGPFVVLAAAAAVLAARWDEIPARFPVHWNVNFQPDRWDARTVTAVFMPLVLGAFLCAAMIFLAYAVLRWTRRVDAGGALAGYEHRFRTTMAWFLLGTSYAMSVLFAWTSLMVLRRSDALPPHFFIPLALVFAVAVIGIVMLARVRLQAARAAGQDSSAGAPVGDRTPDACWKLGVLYFNPADPALIVEKRFGLGYTFNFANPWSWVVMGLLIAVPIAIAFVLVGSK